MRENPVLTNIYRSLPKQSYVLYIDETYSTQGDANTPPYYIICGVLIRSKHLTQTRQDIQEIIGGRYWHTTEALQTPNGRETTEQLLQYCSDIDDTYFISHRVSTDQTTIEQSRRACMKALLKHCQLKFPELKAVIIEARQTHRHNGKDRETIRQMKRDKDLSRNVTLQIVSSAEEFLLWLPDLVAMTYRRRITHNDETSRYYAKYLQSSTTTLIVENEHYHEGKD